MHQIIIYQNASLRKQTHLKNNNWAPTYMKQDLWDTKEEQI